MKRIKKFAVNLLIVGLGTMLGLASVEIGLRLIPQVTLDSAIERTSQRLRLYRLDPRIGWTLKPNAESVITTKDGRAIPTHINALGLRDETYTYQKPANTKRIFILGDSFAEAQDVTLEEAFHYRFEMCLNREVNYQLQVLNGGVSGYNPGDAYLFYKHEGERYDPALVILVLYIGNDLRGLYRTTGERLVAGFGGFRFTLEGDSLKQHWVSWDYPDPEQSVSDIEVLLRRYSKVYRILAHPESKIYEATRQNVESLKAFLKWETDNQVADRQPLWALQFHRHNFSQSATVSPKTKQVWRLLINIIQSLNMEVSASGAQLAVVLLPADYQVDHHARNFLLQALAQDYDLKVDDQWRSDEPNITLIDHLNELSVPALDLFPAFQSHYNSGGTPLYFDGYDQHLNKEGHELMAQLMCDWLLENQTMIHKRLER